MTGEPRAVIVGTGSYGSGYVARVLTAAGVPCGNRAKDVARITLASGRIVTRRADEVRLIPEPPRVLP